MTQGTEVVDEVSEPRLPRSLVLATVGPAVIGAILLMAFVVAELAGSSAFIHRSPQNLAEAAAVADAAAVLRRLRAGEDPSALVLVHPEVISSSVTRVNALEASIWGREIELVKLLDREGAIDATQRTYLACLSQGLGADAITEYLAPNGTDGCDADETLARIQARSQ
jgi:hypothetical protein